MISVLIIGIGSIGERHLRCFQATGRCIVAGCDTNGPLRRTIQGKYGCKTYASLSEALPSAQWDLAVICTPANSHIPIAIQCVMSGLHVLVEKPLSTALDGIDELVALVESREVVARVAYVHRTIPTVAAARKMIRSGQIGDVRQVVVTTINNFAASRPAYAATYFAQRDTGGGCIQDALTHTLHAVEWILAPIERVFCDASHEALKNVEIEDTVNLMARLQGGAAAAFSLNLFQGPDELTFSFYGINGSVRAEVHNHRVGLQMVGGSNWTWTTLPWEERDGMFIRQANCFLDAVEGKPDYLATLEDGLQTLKVNLAAIQSTDTRREVCISDASSVTDSLCSTDLILETKLYS